MVPMQQSFLMGPVALLCLGMALCAQDPEPVGGVYFANGVKVGEVTSSSAIIWTRLTATPERNIEGIPWPDSADAVPAGRTLGDMQDLLSSVPRLDSDTSQKMSSIPGTPPDLAEMPPGCAFAPRCPNVQAECKSERPELLPSGVPGRSNACPLYASADSAKTDSAEARP